MADDQEEQEQSQFDQVLADVRASLKGKPELALIEDHIVPLIQASQADTIEELADYAGDASTELAVRGREVLDASLAFLTTVLVACGWLDDKGEPTDKMPEKIGEAREALKAAVLDYYEMYSEAVGQGGENGPQE